MFKLKEELAIFGVISLIIAIGISSCLRDSAIINNKSKEQKINYVYTKYVNSLKNTLKETQLNNKMSDTEIDRLLGYRSDAIFYVVNKNGDVIASNNKEVKKINSDKIEDGKKEVSVSKYNHVISQITICEYLKDGYYLYFIFFGYTTSSFPTNINLIIIFIISFTLLSWGRIRYISSIKKSIEIIAQGDFLYRVPLKYKNELTELSENINKMASDLEKEDEKRKEFLTNISHDLRTPLTSILGYLNMTKEKKYENNIEFENYIDKINKKSLFLKSMLDDFFQYSKLSSRDIEITKESLNLQELIRQLVEEEELVFQDNDLKLSSILHEEPVNIKGYGELIVRAIDNLLSNALKYSKKNTLVTVKLDKKKLKKEVYAVISISNIPKEPIAETEVKKFFERLYKKDKSRSQEGSGLGLSIVQEILKIHNGFAEGNIENGKIVFSLFLIMEK